jgi:hypothetical protein
MQANTEAGTTPKKGAAGIPKSRNKGTPISLRKKSEKYNAKIGTKSSSVEKDEDNKPAISPTVVYFLLFLVVGSAVFQLVQSLLEESRVSAPRRS